MVNIASMKKIYPILYIILITISIYSCKHDPSKDDVDESLIKHELRKFNVKTSIEEKSSGSFFLIFGGYSSSVKEYTNIRFYFKNCLNEYQFVETDIKNVRVNYPPTAKLMGWASEVIDSPNGNALLRFCFISDSIPEPDSIFKPCFLIFILALKSLSCIALQFLQVHSLSFRVRSWLM